jgi:hypothetical protein
MNRERTELTYPKAGSQIAFARGRRSGELGAGRAIASLIGDTLGSEEGAVFCGSRAYRRSISL